jgi:chromosome segregation protein
MRLAKLKLAGFKSFVDPTTVTFPSSLTGVVGPNGCGKSNIIDAVRWVMGEISAKHLRGDSMADVVFNGSVARKPLGTASVELVFDNSEGKIGGQYANYSEISLRRSVSRDGTSDYFINGTKVRRKDITQLFLGTGLGSRSYAIIEQGMISRVVEAKPDDLRAFLEEAAGISRYKERRRETENRISHTRENLERLNDLREEVDKQIRHLQRQAATARRYQALKDEERKLHAEVLALKLQSLDAESVTKDAAVRENDTAMHAAIADLREAEAAMERIRADQLAKADVLAQTQGRFYEAGAEAARIEQSLQHSREIRQTQQNELAATEAQLAEISGHVQRDRTQIDLLAAELAALGPDLDAAHGRESTAAAALEAAETELAEWQRSADAHAIQISAAHRETEVERARIEELENQQRRLLQQRERLQSELAASEENESGVLLQTLESREGEARDAGRKAHQELEELLASLNHARDQDRTAGQALQDVRSRWQTALGRQVSLDALQQAALGKAAGKVSLWLKSQALDGRPRLAQQLRVERGWERAVETVLGSYLEAVCVEGIDSVAGLLESFDGGQVAFVTLGQPSANSGEAGTLQAKVRGASRLDSILGPVFIAAGLRDALARRAALGTGESVITQDGVWMGRDWLRVSRDLDPRAGVIEREESLRELSVEVTSLAAEVKLHETEVAAIRDRIQDLEDRRERSQVEANRLHREHADLRAGLESGRARQIDHAQRRARIDTELVDITIEMASAHAGVYRAAGGTRAKADRSRPGARATSRSVGRDAQWRSNCADGGAFARCAVGVAPLFACVADHGSRTHHAAGGAARCETRIARRATCRRCRAFERA